VDEAEDRRQEKHHAKQEHHPRPVLALAEPAEESQSVGGGSERKEGGSGPAEEKRDRVREQRAHPAEITFYAVATADECRVAFGDERSTEKDREKEENDPPNFARERGARR
jgi:hypothetical protein